MLFSLYSVKKKKKTHSSTWLNIASNNNVVDSIYSSVGIIPTMDPTTTTVFFYLCCAFSLSTIQSIHSWKWPRDKHFSGHFYWPELPLPRTHFAFVSCTFHETTKNTIISQFDCGTSAQQQTCNNELIWSSDSLNLFFWNKIMINYRRKTIRNHFHDYYRQAIGKDGCPCCLAVPYLMVTNENSRFHRNLTTPYAHSSVLMWQCHALLGNMRAHVLAWMS